MKTLGFNTPIMITFNPDSGALIGRLGEKLSIYYRNDNHDKRGLWFNPDRLVKEQEAKLMKKVNLVCALTNGLAFKSRGYNANTFVLPNGVNLDLFSGDGGEPGDISRIPHPRIGIIGMLDWRTDVDLIEALAHNHQEWSIVLVGPVNSADHKMYKKLRTMANVHFLGSKSVKDIPRYIKAMDVGLIPYKITEYTRDILSLKIFEYSAAGIPTVATSMPELLNYSEIIYIVDGHREFEDCILASLNCPDSKKSQKLFEFVKSNTWLARAEQLSKIIHSIEGKHRGVI
jgi:glycosyltransferase involved in cell wall biosynthesis